MKLERRDVAEYYPVPLPASYLEADAEPGPGARCFGGDPAVEEQVRQHLQGLRARRDVLRERLDTLYLPVARFGAATAEVLDAAPDDQPLDRGQAVQVASLVHNTPWQFEVAREVLTAVEPDPEGVRRLGLSGDDRLMRLLGTGTAQFDVLSATMDWYAELDRTLKKAVRRVLKDFDQRFEGRHVEYNLLLHLSTQGSDGKKHTVSEVQSAIIHAPVLGDPAHDALSRMVLLVRRHAAIGPDALKCPPQIEPTQLTRDALRHAVELLDANLTLLALARVAGEGERAFAPAFDQVCADLRERLAGEIELA